MLFRTRSLAFIACSLLLLGLTTTASAFLGRALMAGEGADMTAVKTGPESAAAGSDVSFHVIISNLGPEDNAPAATLNDPIPAGMTFVSRTQNSGPAFSCSFPRVGAGGTINCTIATLAAGASADFTFVLHIPIDTAPATTFTNIATASSQTFDQNDENNSSAAAVTTPALPSGDLLVTKTGPATVGPDRDVAFTITLGNAGPDAAQNVSLSDTLPLDMTFVSIVQNSGPAFIIVAPAAGSGGTITATLASMANGAIATFTLTGHIPPSKPSGTIYSNIATVTSDNDPNLENNSSTASVTVTSSDISVTKTGPANAFIGGTLSWTITLSNTGPDSTTNASFTDVLPANTTFISLTQNSGPTANCSAPAVGSSGTVLCTFNNSALSGEGSGQFTLVARIASNTADGGIISNTATATSDNADPNTGNNSSTAMTTAVAPAIIATAGTPQGTQINTPFPTALRVNVKDSLNNNLPNIAVTFTVHPSAGGASATFVGGTTCAGLPCAAVITDVNGNATAPTLTANSQAGNYTVTTTAGSSPSSPITITANAPNAVTAAVFNLRNMLSPSASEGVISGRIMADDGTPVAGAVINLAGAQSRKTITDVAGNYHFDQVETAGLYVVTPSRANYNFNPFNRSFSQNGARTEAVFTGLKTGDSVNPLDTPEYFVRQQYLDLLNREPDEPGLNFWSNRILDCGDDVVCVNARRRDVAAEFFIAREFQRSGAFIYDLYQGALGRRPQFSEYTADRQLVVGGPNLETERAAFADSFVQRPEFVEKYQDHATAEGFVDALIKNVRQSSGVALNAERDGLIGAYNGGGNLPESRSLAIRAVANNEAFQQASYNSAFVLTEYFGYLRREPDKNGYTYWLNVLNDGTAGNYRGMVCSFITSTEYQARFSAVVSHSNGECGQ
jgi:uncharacterized repeat protein (TIGR01451 family)